MRVDEHERRVEHGRSVGKGLLTAALLGVLATATAAGALQGRDDPKQVKDGRPAACSDTPNLGSEEIPCNDFKEIYKDEEPAKAVVVVLDGSRDCTAKLFKNAKIGQDGSVTGTECGAAARSAVTVTCRNAKNLVLQCKGVSSAKCKYRIVQVNP